MLACRRCLSVCHNCCYETNLGTIFFHCTQDRKVHTVIAMHWKIETPRFKINTKYYFFKNRLYDIELL